MKFFVEIGVADFGTLYPLLENGWSGIMIDPNAELLDNIPDHPNLIKEYVAIDTTEGEEDFLMVQDKDIFEHPSDIIGMSGFVKTPTPLHDPFFNEYTKVIKVPTARLDDILDKHNVTHIDFLKIDTEGHDGIILRDYSFRIIPQMIKFEHSHFSGLDCDVDLIGMSQKYYTQLYNDLLEMFRKLRYITWVEKGDVYCIR